MAECFFLSFCFRGKEEEFCCFESQVISSIRFLTLRW